MNSWWFRMKPRSILRTIEWFQHFAALEGEDWNLEDAFKKSRINNRNISITRRKYLFLAHKDELNMSYDDLMSGEYDENEIESQARNDKTSFEFYGFGYVDDRNIVRVTEFGRLIVENKINGEYLLKQLLKLQFPNPRTSSLDNNGFIFPLEIFLEVYSSFDYLYITELAFIFGCIDMSKVDEIKSTILDFRTKFEELSQLKKKTDTDQIFETYFYKLYPNIKNKASTYLDYADAFARAISYTGLFLTKGRSNYTKLYIPEHAKTKVKLLHEKYTYKFNDKLNIEDYMDRFGDVYSTNLPWENSSDRKLIVESKFENYRNIISEVGIIDKEVHKGIYDIEQLIRNNDYKSLLIADELLSRSLLSINEKNYIENTSKTKVARDEIIDKFIDIKEGNEEASALWLEVNTWRSLVAMSGDHQVKRNFKIEEDLTPRSFAPGAGNTPDMELYVNGYIFLAEVSLMSGVKQWEHEGSSVIDHVLKFIEKYSDKEVFGLFISKTMNLRSIWQFFILNKESWIGKYVPVIPLTINQYIDVISFIYDKEIDIHYFSKLIVNIHNLALSSKNFKEWESQFPEVIENWKALS